MSLKRSSPGERIWKVGTLIYSKAGLIVLFSWLLWGDFAWSLRDRSVTSMMQVIFKKFGASDLLTALLIGSLPAAIAVVLTPMVSCWSDRYRSPRGRRIPFLLFTTPPAALALFGLAFCPVIATQLSHWLGGRGAWSVNTLALASFAVCWTVFEISTVTSNTIYGGLINDVVPASLLGRFYAMFRALSLIAGMIFNFWIFGYAESKYQFIFIAVGLIYGGGFLLMCLKVKEGTYPPPEKSPACDQRPFWQGTKQYFRECFGQRYYLLYFATWSCSWMAFTPVILFNFYFAKSLGMSLSMFGKCLALTYLISLALSYPIGVLVDRLHPLRMSLITQVLYLVVMLLGGLFASNIYLFAIAFVAHGVVSGAWITATSSLGQRLFPKEQFARYYSAAGIVSSLGAMIIGPLAGELLDRTGHLYRETYFLAAVLTALALWSGICLYRRFLLLGGPENYLAP